MLAFLLQTLFLALITFVIGWFLGRFIKGFFCKVPSNTRSFTKKPMAVKIDENKNNVDSDSSSSSSNSSNAIKTAVASTAAAATIGTMVSDLEKDEKLPSTDELALKTPDVMDKVDPIVDPTVTDIEEGIAHVQTKIVDEIKTEESVVDIESPKIDVQDKISAMVDTKADTELDKLRETDAEAEIERSNLENNPPPKNNDKGFDDISNIISGRASILSTKDNTEIEQTNLVDEKNQNIEASVDSDDSSDNNASSLSDMAKTATVVAGAAVVAKAGMDSLDAQTADKDNIQQENLPDNDNSTVDLIANKADESSGIMSDTEEKLEEAFTEKLDQLTHDEVAIEDKETVDLVANKADESSGIMSDAEEKLEEAFTEKLDQLTHDEVALDAIEDKETVDLVTDKADEASDIMSDAEEKLEVAFTEKLDQLTNNDVALDPIENDDSSDNNAPFLSDMAKTATVVAGATVVAKASMDSLESQTADKDNIQQETLADITNDKSIVDPVVNEANKASEIMSDTEEKLEVAFTEKLDKLTNDEVALDSTEDQGQIDETNQELTDTDKNSLGVVFSRRNMRRFRSARR